MSFTLRTGDPKLIATILNVGKQKPSQPAVVSEMYVRNDTRTSPHWPTLVKNNVGREGSTGYDIEGKEVPDVTVLEAKHNGGEGHHESYSMAYHTKNDNMHQIHILSKDYYGEPTSQVVNFTDEQAKHIASALNKG